MTGSRIATTGPGPTAKPIGVFAVRQRLGLPRSVLSPALKDWLLPCKPTGVHQVANPRNWEARRASLTMDGCTATLGLLAPFDGAYRANRPKGSHGSARMPDGGGARELGN